MKLKSSEVIERLKDIKIGSKITVRWADAAEIRQLSRSKFRNHRLPQSLLETVMEHTGKFMGIQEDETSGKKYLILLLHERDDRIDLAIIPIDLIFAIKYRKGKRLYVVKVPMLSIKYQDGSIKESGGVIKIAG